MSFGTGAGDCQAEFRLTPSPWPTVERKEWMQALQQAVAEQRARAQLSGASLLGIRDSEPPDRAGSLELRGFKNKLYVAVVGDKVQLYKNLEVRSGQPGY